MDKTIYTDIAVIGGGASGIVSAVSAARYAESIGKNIDIVILEKEDRIGKKLLLTGNGKCNITNKNINKKFYYSNDMYKLQNILNRFSSEYIMNFFSRLGIIFHEDSEGRVYPYCNQAAAVLNVLREELNRLSIREICKVDINNIDKKDGYFIIKSDVLTVKSKKIIVSTGGKSSALSCNNPKIYKYLIGFGHTMLPIFPSLVQVKTDSNFIKSLKGLRCRAKVSLVADGLELKSEIGELQFSDNALSGICVFSLSRLVSEYFNCGKILGKSYKKLFVVVDLLPEYSKNDIYSFVKNRVRLKSDSIVEDFLLGAINKRIAIAFFKSINIPLSKKVSELDKSDINNIAYSLKNWRFEPKGVMPWKNAQVTAGGIDISEFNEKTMESKKLLGLFACGEVLNVDGDCGGFNLHWAWSSGYLAGENAAKSLFEI